MFSKIEGIESVLTHNLGLIEVDSPNHGTKRL